LKLAPTISPSSGATVSNTATLLSTTAIGANLQFNMDQKQGLFDTAQHSLQVLDYTSFPNGEALKESQVMITVNLAKELNDAKTQLWVHSQGTATDSTSNLTSHAFHRNRTNALVKDIPQTMIATLDPITIHEVHVLAHKLYKTGTLMIKSKTKYEMMEADGFIAKVTCTKSCLQPHASIKDQGWSTNHSPCWGIYQCYENVPSSKTKVLLWWKSLWNWSIPASAMITYYPQFSKGSFAFQSEWLPAGNFKFQVNNILDMSSLKPHDKDIPSPMSN
jgi:hypothetical protein